MIHMIHSKNPSAKANKTPKLTPQMKLNPFQQITIPSRRTDEVIKYHTYVGFIANIELARGGPFIN